MNLAAIFTLFATAGHAQDVLTHHNDFYRSGAQSHETALTPQNVNPATFGKLFSLAVDGQVYAQPLWVGGYTMADGNAHNVLFVATEHDSVYAFDADGKPPLAGNYWHVSLLGSGETTVPAPDTQTNDITPEIGITGTPVIDRALGVIYLVAKSKRVSGGQITYVQRLHALSLSTGAEVMGAPVTIAAAVPGTGDGTSGNMIQFNPLTENQRAALALANGSVWIAWASHGDNPPYHGFVIGFNASDVTQQTGVFADTPNGSDGGIWMSGGGISVDEAGNFYVASGNGTYDANTASGADYGDTVMKFTPTSTGLDMATSFTPYDQNTLSNTDLDFGTSACTLIDNPDGPYPKLLVTTDKDGRIYLVDRDKMGGYHQNTNNDIQDFSNGGASVHASFAFFNNALYLAGDGGALSAWSFNPQTGKFNTLPATAPDSTFGCNECNGSGGTPSISANGTANAVVWLLDDTSYLMGPAVLHAYNASLSKELYTSAMAANGRDRGGVAVKFTTPAIANGFVYVGGAQAVTVYGLLKNAPPTVAAPAIAPAGGAYAGPQTVTITDKTPGSVIHYTTNGSAPTGASAVYTHPIRVASTTIIQAAAMAPGLATSAIAEAQYALGTPGNIFTLNSGMTASDFQLNGSAQMAGGRLRLTDGNENEAGSAYFRLPVRVGNFTTHFDFQMTDANADGMTFVLEAAGATALGPVGGGLGYGPAAPGPAMGIARSAAVKFDLYSNAGEGIDSTGFYIRGASPTVPAVTLAHGPINLHSGHVFAVELLYNGSRLYETITDTETRKSAMRSYAANLEQIVRGGEAFAGFTGGTGGETVTADVLNWSWSAPPVETFAASALAATVSKAAPVLKPWRNASFPAGAGVLFPATGAGQSVTFTVDVKSNATFMLSLLADAARNRGTIQLAIDGKEFGAPVDEYSAQAGELNVSLGDVLLYPGRHTFTFTVTGKAKASSGFEAAFGELKLKP